MKRTQQVRKSTRITGKSSKPPLNTFSRSELDAFRVLNDLHTNAFNMVKYISNVAIIVSGMGIVTLFSKDSTLFQFSLFCFSVSILVNMSVNIIAGAALYDSTRIYVDMFVVGNSKDKMYIYRNYKTFQKLAWLGVVISFLFIFFGISDAYNSIMVIHI